MLTFGYRNKRECTIRAILALVFGVILLFNGSFAGWIIKTVIGFLIVVTILQLIVFGSFRSTAKLDPGSIFSSIVVIIIAAVLLLNPFSISLMRLIAGVCLIIYGINELLSTPKVNAAITDDYGPVGEDKGVDEQ